MSGDKNYLAEHGAALLANGYPIIPIVKGSKRPPGDFSKEKGYDWTEIDITPDELKKWLKRPLLRTAGIGIRTANFPAVDVDSRDPDLVKRVLDWIEANITGEAPLRIGEAPKSLLMFRAEDGETFTKLLSRTFYKPGDPQDRDHKHQVEILGDGQQYVCAAIHPDTGKPYFYPNRNGPLKTPAASLPVLSKADAVRIIDAFNDIAADMGFEAKKAGPAGRTSYANGKMNGHAIEDEDLAVHGRIGTSTAPLHDIDNAELRRLLMLIPNDPIEGEQGYDDWLNYIMAVWHQTEGSDEGLDIALEWSRQANKFDEADLLRRWKSFNHSGKSQRPITARIIVKAAAEFEDADSLQQLEAVRAEMRACDTLQQLEEVASKAKTIEMTPARRESLVGLLRDMFKRIERNPLGLGTARGMVRFEESEEERVLPEWLEPWVYCDSTDDFYNVRDGRIILPAAFNRVHARLTMTEQEIRERRAVPESQPTDVALNVFGIPAVHRRLYMPSMERLFDFDGQPVVNTYSSRGVPKRVKKFTEQDLEDVAEIERHFVKVLGGERAFHIVFSVLSHIVKTRGRVNWAPLIQSVEGVGKTMLADMMGSILGSQNVGVFRATDLEKEYNAWQEGRLLNVGEEIKAHGFSKYDVHNALKSPITNDKISIRKMRTDQYMAPNTASYVLFTNYKDALPIDNRDRRYFIIFSPFQTPEAIADAGMDGAYFVDLYNRMQRNPGAIRKWLWDFEPHPDFQARGRAPHSSSFAEMVALNKSEEQEAVEDVLEEQARPWFTPTLLDGTALGAQLADAGLPIPRTALMGKILADLGFTMVGRMKVNQTPHRFYSKTPERFVDETGKILTDKIRLWMDDGGL